VTLTIISAEDYNNFLRQQNDVRDLSDKYQALLEQFQDLRAAQEKLAGDEAALRSQVSDANPRPRTYPISTR